MRRRPELQTYSVGALPVVNRYLKRLGLGDIVAPFLPASDRRRKIPPDRVLLVLVRNLLISREPLYAVGRWAGAFHPALLGLSPQEQTFFNDDRAGRALVDLFDADRPSLILRVVVQAVRRFGLRLDRFHNDSTTIWFEGAYRNADGRRCRGKPTPKITYGHSKDHRPDLKQLLWSLTVTADGAVPVNYQVFHGNTNDDTTHRQTWDILAQIAGRTDFLYVADSKLCARPNMTHIASREGRFLTVLPASRKEDRRFRDWMQNREVPWKQTLRKIGPGRRKALPEIIGSYEDPAGSVEGYRIVWYHSSDKQNRDRREREEKVDRAIRMFQGLRDRLGSSRTRLRRREKIDKEIEEIMEGTGTGRWLEIQVGKRQEVRFRQSRRGRPGPETTYKRKIRTRFDITWNLRQENVKYDAQTDGIFPLLTNDRAMTLLEILTAYKVGQPPVEQRHHNLKSFHEVAPQYLKSVVRIEAFLCVYFLALLVDALIEREVRQAMKAKRIRTLALYPEDRPCRRPTTAQVLKIFDGLLVHHLREKNPNRAGYVYSPTLSPLQKRLLRLLGVPPADFRFS